MSEAAIVVEGLTKVYGDLVAVDQLDLEVPRGQTVAVLGPNGAGKTTTVEMIEGFRQPTSGRISVLGRKPSVRDRALKDRIGILFQQSALEDELTVREAIAFHAVAYDQPLSPKEVLELVDLGESENTRVKVLSGGQRRRLDFAIALVGRPDVLFLDEPTTGFDPEARRVAWEVIEQRSDTTIVLTTHYLEEAHRLAERVVVLSRGRIVFDGAPHEMIKRDSSTIRFRIEADAAQMLDLEPGPDGQVVIETDAPVRELAQLTNRALDTGATINQLEVSGETLEDAYLRLIGDS